MKVIIDEMKPNNIDYSVDYISCYQKAFGTCLNKFNPDYARLFYMLSSACKCYEFSKFKDLDFQAIQSKIINDVFQISFATEKVSDNFHDEIMDHIKAGNPVVVPGNLRELFYSQHYKESDWGHPFIIKGFDSDKQLYYIIDDAHLTGDVSKDFSIRYEDLESVFNAFNTFISSDVKHRIYVFSKNSKNLKEPYDVFSEIISIYLDEYHYEHKEKILLDQICQDELLKGNYENQFFNPLYILKNMPKYKEVFFAELIHSFQLYMDVSEKTLTNLENQKNDLKSLWEMCINSFFKKYYRNSQDMCLPNIDLAIKAERSIYDEIKFICNSKSGNKSDLKKAESSYVIENGQGIVTYKENTFCFNFDGSQIYNTWFHDESPKVMYDAILLNNKFQVSVEIADNPENADFTAGIVLKTVDEQIFFFGIDGEKRINLDKANAVESYSEILGKFKKVTLSVDLSEEKKCNFVYKLPNKEESFLFHSLEISAEIKSIGFGCKTYNRAKLLDVRFNQTEK